MITDHISPEEFMEMRKLVGFTLFPEEQAAEGLKHSSYIQNNTNFFNLTKGREDLFKLLDDKLSSNNIFLPICGPEGKGKTSSILAY